VWIVGEEPELHQVVVALHGVQAERWDSNAAPDELRRTYAIAIAKTRVHQPLFRARVLHAYENRCAICRFAHQELLDASHIRADSAGGHPVVSNGLALCKIHHGAYDANFLSVDPDYRVHIRADLLTESDGPTLRHALQAPHRSKLAALPSQRGARPDRHLLAERHKRFLEGS
jgi:putative restriction endonuclease